jgi:hypothetical protein
VKRRGKGIEEKICVEHFLSWYNKQRKEDCIYEKTEDHFTELKGKLCWDFMVYERGNPQEWIGIEVKELSTMRDVSGWSEFWNKLCLELTEDSVSKGIRGKFTIIHPPVLNLRPEKRINFRRAFVEVLTNKQSMLKGGFVDIGPDIADKFPNWPKEKSEPFDEYDKWGTYRPCKLEIKKISDSGCEVISPISPIVLRDGVELHEKTFNEADIKHANKQLKLAKERGTKKTILLFACHPFIEESLIKDQVQNLDRHLISDIDSIYLVATGNKDIVVPIYPD